LFQALCNPEFRELNKTNGILALQELLLRQQKEQKKNSVAPPMDVKVPRGHLESTCTSLIKILKAAGVSVQQGEIRVHSTKTLFS
jgi:hypothetical protein